METLLEAYKLAKQNKGAPGIDGVSFEMVEAIGVEQYLQAIQKELSENTLYLGINHVNVVKSLEGTWVKG